MKLVNKRYLILIALLSCLMPFSQMSYACTIISTSSKGTVLAGSKENTNVKEKQIDELLNYYYGNKMFYGSVLVAEKGRVIYKNAFGYSNIETKEALTLNIPSCLGSISKQFTSMAIMILKEQNKLSYEDKLAMYFPEIPRSNEITIRNLLNHTSGLYRFIGRPGFRLTDDLTNQDLFNAIVSDGSFKFQTGEEYSYSNSGYILLAMIIEKVSGEPFYKFMNRNIFSPLDMKNTFVHNREERDIEKKAIGYDQFDEKSDFNVLLAGAGGIYSTVEDLYKWDQALYTEKLLSQATLNEAFTPGLLNNGESSRTLSDSTWGYGFGWLLRKNSNENITWHDGGFNGFSALIYRELNNKDCIIILVNKGQKGINSLVYPIRDAVLNILEGQQYVFPKISIASKIKNLIDNTSIEVAVNEYNQLRETFDLEYDFSENQLNSLGYYYLNKNKLKEAIAIFKLNVETYPDLSNPYDSIAEAYMKNGQNNLAIQNYEKSLELNPDNTNAIEMLKQLK